jgi:DNA-binding SARP family transcriptional activator
MLASLLWPEASEANARASLRKAVADLRGCVPDHVKIGRRQVAFDRNASYWLDLDVFYLQTCRALMQGTNPLADGAAAMLEETVALYRGPFLEEIEPREAPGFEQWLLLEREHGQQLAILALGALVDHWAAAGDHGRALAHANWLLVLEPAHEGAHRYKMSLLAASQQRAVALRQFRACRLALAALDAEPEGETLALYEGICSGRRQAVVARVSAPNLLRFLVPLAARYMDLVRVPASGGLTSESGWYQSGVSGGRSSW